MDANKTIPRHMPIDEDTRGTTALWPFVRHAVPRDGGPSGSRCALNTLNHAQDVARLDGQ